MIQVRLYYWDMETSSIPGYFQVDDESVVYTMVADFPYDYTGEDILEHLFAVFNFEHNIEPKNIIRNTMEAFDQRSMSVGDVVVLNIEGREQWNLCARSGWIVIEPYSINIKEEQS